MAANGWYDTGKGYYANDYLSKKVRQPNAPSMAYMDAARQEPGTGKGQGDTVNFLKTYEFDNTVQSATAISETAPIPEDTIDRAKGTITVREYGRAYPLTEAFRTLSAFDPMDMGTKSVKRNMGRALNRLAATAIKQTLITYAPTGSTGTPTSGWKFDGTTTTATRDLQMFDLIAIRDMAVDRFHMTPIGGGSNGYNFRVVVPQTTRSLLLNDPIVANQISYAYMGKGQASPFANGVLPVWQGIAIDVDNDVDTTGLLGGTSFRGAGVFYGDDAVAYSMPLKPEIRVKTGKYAGDYGRDQGVAWYGLMGFSITRGDTPQDIANNQAVSILITST